MKGIFVALKGTGNWVIPITSLLMAAYIWNVAYGVFKGSPDDVGSTWFVNSLVMISFLIIQGIFSAVKGKITVGLFLMDLLVSAVGAVISGYVWFEETFRNANVLSPFQEQLMLLFFITTLGDVLMGAINDGTRMILTDETKIIR